MFDVEEYFHLALHAGAAGQHHACMTYLKKILRRQPRNAPALYLLAAQHAELGLLERAVSGMQAALAIKPTMEIARFQLGMMLLESNRRAEAKENFAAIRGSADCALRTFCEAMIALADGQSGIARELLALGVSRESGHRALPSLMRRVLDGLLPREQAMTGEPAAHDNHAFPVAHQQTSS